MKSYKVVKYYRESLSFKFHEDPFTNARPRVIKVRTRDVTCMRGFTTNARGFIAESS